ncbi:MAG: type II toxin-antitoxin system VapC family toxin [Moraxellaceae bacterium]|nr:type II toxin-antitoxin system VapC family toxin [Moraxellaceae bacterium]MCP5175954.1 type II toxin-antitoxin system VapC family toxin [Moraxellaceae bacterium]HQV22938.1 type II toxin-antitoxin system VapC family toxin [Agitococcus sp.]
MRYMLDTNICIHLIQKQPLHVVQKFATLQYGDVVISSITLAELRYGVERDSQMRSAAEAALNNLLRFLPVLSFEQQAAEQYGVLRALVRDRKRDALDRLIAAHALSQQLTLVTNNEADFKDYPLLTVENWIQITH